MPTTTRLAEILLGATVGVLTVGCAGEQAASPGDEARQRCESATVARLAAPSTAQLTDVAAEESVLDADSRDLFSLLEDPLAGVDQSRIEVWNVTGTADSVNGLGDRMRAPFTCRAYFVDGELVHTLVLLDEH